MTTRSREVSIPNPPSGVAMLAFAILLFLGAIAGTIVAGNQLNDTGGRDGAGLLVVALLSFPAVVLLLRGLVLVNPNQSKVVVLFGKYRGTLRRDGFYWINPFTV